MYRYSVDKAITYTSEDIVLFKESPFACWMERLTLENPEHGILPDAGSVEPRDSMEPQDDLADTLRAEGKNVVLVSWEASEPERRTATLEAMRHGTDFIVNGQLALGSLSGSANLLMRTSGYSELGSFLYVPCNTQPKTNMHSALRLCFLADLLHSLQGQLPPQMLIIRGGTDVVPLQTEDHIYHFRAVKQRFMATQHAFRKHKMPDPSESSHFGRWADCANEVLKQRALRPEDESSGGEDIEETQVIQQLQAGSAATAYDLDEVSQAPHTTDNKPDGGGTLAEQARCLHTGGQEVPSRTSSEDTLQNLAFIGSGLGAPSIGQPAARARKSPKPTPPVRPRAFSPAPTERAEEVHSEIKSVASDTPRHYDRRLSAIRPEQILAEEELPVKGDSPIEKSHPLDSPGFQRGEGSMIDRDANPAPSATEAPPPTLSNESLHCDQPAEKTSGEVAANPAENTEPDERFLGSLLVDPFNSSLITGTGTDTDTDTDDT